MISNEILYALHCYHTYIFLCNVDENPKGIGYILLRGRYNIITTVDITINVKQNLSFTCSEMFILLSYILISL